MTDLPIAPLTLPSALVGVLNGALTAGQLDTIGVQAARMERTTAARAARAMVAALRAAGHDVRHVGDYRSYDAQIGLFVSRYQAVTSTAFWATPSARRKRWLDEPRKPANLQGDTYWVKKLVNGRYPATAATPGTSNHGLGLALDFAEELDGDPQPEAISPAMVDWLIDNAWRYGFSAELQSEPWHWRYVTGDAIPAAVLEFEGGTPVPPPVEVIPPTVTIMEEDDVKLYRKQGKLAVWLAGQGVRTHVVNEAQLQQLAPKFGPTILLDSTTSLSVLGMVVGNDPGDI